MSEIEEWGRPERLRISTNENFEQAKPFVGKTVSSVALETIRQFTNNFYEANRWLFEERIQQRRIRDRHGDEFYGAHGRLIAFLVTIAFWGVVFGALYFRFVFRPRRTI